MRIPFHLVELMSEADWSLNMIPMNKIKALLGLLFYAFTYAAHAWDGKPAASNSGPVQVVATFVNALIHEKSDNRFGLNKRGQFQLLSKQLQDLASSVECNSANAEVPEGPALKPPPFSTADAETVFDRWDIPTSCTALNTKAHRRLGTVSVNCTWDGTTDHSAGERLQLIFSTKVERGRWVVSNVRHGKQIDAHTHSDLLGRLKIGASYAPIPAACMRRP